MQKFKSIKILFIFLIGSVTLAKMPLYGSLFIIVLVYLLNFKSINEEFKNFKFSNLKFLLLAIPMILINYLSLFLISKVTSLPQNETLLRSLVTVSPLHYSFVFGVLSPISEELTFRYGFNGIKNKYVYLIFTSLLYASFHLSNLSEILYIIPYFILGLFFAYIYKKTDSVVYPIMLHIINNLVSLLLMIF